MQVNEKRIALLLAKSLGAGESANVAAIIMGQLAMQDGDLFASETLKDPSGVSHAGIRHSTIVLSAGAGQLRNLVARTAEESELNAVAFSAFGQRLHNRFTEYVDAVVSGNAEELVGVGISGPDDRVRAITRSFSLLR